MLLMVVAVFLICNILPFVNNFMESMGMPLSQNLVDLSNFLVSLNSSVNCFIYCIFGAKFRKHFIRLLLRIFPCLRACIKDAQSDPACYPLSATRNTIRLHYNRSERTSHASTSMLLPTVSSSATNFHFQLDEGTEVQFLSLQFSIFFTQVIPSYPTTLYSKTLFRDGVTKCV